MMDQPLQEVETTQEIKGTTKFGLAQVNNPTPKWAVWAFRIEFLLNKTLLFVLGASTLFTADQVKESLVWIAAVDAFVWGFGKFLGVSKDNL